MTTEWDQSQERQVQRLALRGYDFDASCHLVLKVQDARSACKVLASVLDEPDWVTFGQPDSARKQGEDDDREPAVSIGFTYRGLQAIGVPDRYLCELRTKAPAFCEGAPIRAARRLGDCGPGATEQWEPMFSLDYAHVLISVHGPNLDAVRSAVARLRKVAGASDGFDGWEAAFVAEHLTKDHKYRIVHFGFRDNIALPLIDDKSPERRKLRHRAGELVLGYLNDDQFNRWDDDCTEDNIVDFFRNGSFAVLRKIQQDEERFDEFLERQVKDLSKTYPYVTQEYLRAKLCGRWPNGARIDPAKNSQPDPPTDDALRRDCEIDFSEDKNGFGCPFGAHIRRTNPRADPIAPPRLRPIFRRGMPYGPRYDKNSKTKNQERGLIGLFFGASIEDQFETVLSEWVEKKPMGPDNRGNAKDPLVGHHDDAAFFHIPRQYGPDIKLSDFKPFVTTRGTLYALFPSCSTLRKIARIKPDTSPQAQSGEAPKRADAQRSSGGTRPEVGAAESEIDTAPNDRFCDIVMEGGVTSGIIYATAVSELAKFYRFSKIGGSSIGAFAAGLAAAAEYSRRRGSIKGFQLMAGLPAKLAEEDNEHKTQLLRLFRPQQGTRRLFEIFLATLGDKATVTRRLGCGLSAAIRQYRRAVLFAAVTTTALVLAGPLLQTLFGFCTLSLCSLALRIVGLGSWLLALFIALVSAVAATLIFVIVRDFRNGVVPNGFGLCRGWSESSSSPFDSPDLAGYLHASIQTAAGRNPIDDPPLTFQDLWEAPGSATEVFGYKGSGDARSIDLEVYTTNLAHGRPYRFPLDPTNDLSRPFLKCEEGSPCEEIERELSKRQRESPSDDMGRLFFKPEELKPYFPAPVLNHLIGYSRPYRPQSCSDPERTADTDQYLELPSGQLPIVVAARLAMSFPLLISAVPLWAIDYEARRGERGFARCWMSDGGLCSNFPIHLFDSFVPEWPTFGIALLNRGKYRPDQCVWLPDKHFEGRADTWYRFADFAGRLSQLAGFLVSLWLAAWRWNDSTMMRMPGVRDRVVRVLLKKDEGGVNIKMSKDAIEKLSENYGKPAAVTFLKKFAADKSPGWPEHRWVRFNRLLIALRQQIEGVMFAADLDRYMQPLRAQIKESAVTAPLRGPSQGCPSPSEKPLSAERIRELTVLLAALSKLESRFTRAGNHTPYVAVPRPSLRVRHPT